MNTRKRTDGNPRLKVIKELIQIYMGRHLFAQILIMFFLLILFGIEGHYFLIHHDYFYEHKVQFILLIAVNGLVILFIRKFVKFVTWVLFGTMDTGGE